METRTCNSCKEEKPITAFGTRSGVTHSSKQCKACLAAKVREHMNAVPGRYNEKKKKYKAKNPIQYKLQRSGENRHLRRAIKNGSKGKFTEVEFQALYANYDHRCYYCTEKIKGTVHRDHFIPLNSQGDNNIANIVPACPRCNVRKGIKMPWVFKVGETFSPKAPELWKQLNGL